MMDVIMKKKRNKFFILIILICILLSCGCSKLDELEIKAGIKNSDFEYIKQGKVEEVTIQSTRDQGFKFVVTDSSTIKDLYGILSSAEKVSKKSSLEPDYTLEIKENNKNVHKFFYVAGLDKNEGGNLYNGKQTYIVSKRIDNEMINSFWNIRMPPSNFKEVYYGAIISTLDKYFKDKDKNEKIGVDFNEDVDAARFILSTDLQEFKSELVDKFKNANIGNNDMDKYDVWVTVKTEGYKTTLYKATINFWDVKKKSEKIYYIKDVYENGRWNITISEDKLDGF